MHTTINIQAKMIGVKRPLIPNWSLPIPAEMAGRSGTTLRDLIARVVEGEVAAFQDRQAERRFARLLTKDQIESAAGQGKVDAAGRSSVVAEVDIDCQEAISNALIAFEDGLYYVFLDELQIESLDQPLYLGAESQVTFLRLVPLAGG
jgi:hypothetical protein